MLPGLLITIDLPHLTVVLRQDHTVTFRAARFLRSHVGKPDLPAENTHIDPQEFFFFFSSWKLPWLLPTELLSLTSSPEYWLCRGTIIRPATLYQKCFHSASVKPLMGKHDNGEVASWVILLHLHSAHSDCRSEFPHFDAVLVLCRDVERFLRADRVLVKHMCGRQTVLTVTHFPACSPAEGDRPAVSMKRG